MRGFWIYIIPVIIYWGKPVRYDGSKYFKQGLHQSNTNRLGCWEHRPYLLQLCQKVWVKQDFIFKRMHYTAQK